VTATLYAGTTTSGVYKSTTSGDNWNPVSTNLTDLHITALAIDPHTPSTLYAGTFQTGLFKSTNSGGKWSQIGSSLTGYAKQVYSIVVNPVTPATVYAGTFGGMYKSANSGGSWDPIPDPHPLAHAYIHLTIDPSATSVLYAGS
jgi:photosystem II stability/assembly factor-like uncharacterized protein